MNRVHPFHFYYYFYYRFYYYFIDIIIIIIDIVFIIEIIDHLSLCWSELTNHSLFRNCGPLQAVLGIATLLLYKILIWYPTLFT